MNIAELPFGEWLPDAPDYKNPGCIVADNCFPSTGGYSSFPGFNDQGDTINEAVRGAQQFFRSDGTSVIVGGTSTKLFVVVGGTLTETTGYTAIGADAYWDFARFNDLIIAVAPNNAPQYLTDIDSDTGWSALPGSPPTMETIGRVGNFLMLGNASANKSRVQWSAENDPTASWVTDRTAQSGLAELQPEYGKITAIAGDRYPLVFQERGISRIDPVGPPTVFNIQTIEEARGCIAPGSAVTVGFLTYFLAHDGFWATDGASVQPVGTRRVNKWFFDNVSEGDRFRTHGAVVWEKQSIIWTFYPVYNATGFLRQIIYSWAENRWSTASVNMHYLVDNKVDATTLEDLDALFPTGIEDVTPVMDSTFWLAKSRVLSAFRENASGNSELSYLNGDTLEATFETADHQPKPGYRVSVNAIYPVVENDDENTEAALITRTLKGSTPVTSAQTAINAAGFCPVRGDGRFARAKMVIPAAAVWDKAQGVQLEFRASGKR
jgi:hypothetical protein